MRINLSELADHAGNGTVNLIEWIAQKLTDRSHIRVQPRDIQSWLERWPSILILDGLDEVANPYARSVIVQAIDDYLVEAAYAPMDTLLAVTTRPQGYGRELDESQFQTIELEPLETASALQCAERLAESRHEDDEDRKAELLNRVSDALEQELTARLMTTPLQVAIMFLLLENNNRPPRDRHGLFEAYYRTIYAREVNKSNPLAAQLERHRGHVDALHEQVGLKLQALAESAHDSDATLPSGTVEDLARQRLQRQGYEEDESAKIAKDIVRAATDRLVLLVRRGGDDFGYELRSFQEYMAARAITNGTEQDVLKRLRLIAPAAHWRNTWLFAAGRIFSMPNSEHMKHPVITLVRDLDTSSLLRMEVGIGPELALDLLDDDVAHDSPIHRRALLHEALALLGEPPTRVEALARVLLSVEASDKAMYSKIRQEFAAAIVGTPISQATGRLVGAALARGLGGLAVAARQLTGSTKLDPEQWQLLKAWQGQYLDIPEGAVRGKVKLSSPLAEILEAQPLTGPSLQLGESVIELLSRVVLKTFSAQRLALPPTRTIFGPALVEALEDEELSDRIASAISSIRPCDWILRAALVVQFRTVIQRKPVGDDLLPQFE